MAKWVDDVITRGNRKHTDKFWSNMEKRWKMRSWGYVEPNSPRTYCSKKIEVEIKDGVKWYSITQADDIKQWLTDMGVTGMRPVSTPMSSREELNSNETLLGPEDASRAQSILGSLQYYSKETRDDISATVNIIAQRMKEPTVGVQKALNRVLAYLLGTVDRKLLVPRIKGTKWLFYVDSDHAGERKYGNTRSRTGIKLMCNNMQFHWRSSKQPETAMSSAAAEIVAMSECMKDVNLRMWIAEEAGIEVRWPVEILVDNKAGVNFQNKMNPDSKLKGVFDMRLGWLAELHDKKKFKAVKIATEINLADDLTKPLAPHVKQKLDKVHRDNYSTLVAPLGGK